MTIVQSRGSHDTNAIRRAVALVLALVCLAAVTASSGAAGTQSPSARPARAALVNELPRALSVARMRQDLRALERIADRNGGSRAAGTPGYAASVRYVRDQLRRAGYESRVAPFPYVQYLERVERGRQIAPVQRELQLEALDYSPSTPPGGLRGRVVGSGDGCSADDFGAVRGLIALVERGTCFFSVKAANAQRAGAIGLIVFNSEEGLFNGTLGDPQASDIPVAAIARALGRELLAATDPAVEMELVTETRRATSENVTSDARRPRPRTLIVGAHLDSVGEGPGINDNATGVVALLELARALAKRSHPLSVRFAFWGAEELGLIGSRAYAATVPRDDVVGYLNFDVLGSPSRQYGVYGDSRFTTRWLRYLRSRGAGARPIDIEGRSDHAPFAQRGIPVAGIFAGGYPCYHRACDRVANVDFTSLARLASAAAFAVASFAPLSR
jgi:hypothetical protein